MTVTQTRSPFLFTFFIFSYSVSIVSTIIQLKCFFLVLASDSFHSVLQLNPPVLSVFKRCTYENESVSEKVRRHRLILLAWLQAAETHGDRIAQCQPSLTLPQRQPQANQHAHQPLGETIRATQVNTKRQSGRKQQEIKYLRGEHVERGYQKKKEEMRDWKRILFSQIDYRTSMPPTKGVNRKSRRKTKTNQTKRLLFNCIACLQMTLHRKNET